MLLRYWSRIFGFSKEAIAELDGKLSVQTTHAGIINGIAIPLALIDSTNDDKDTIASTIVPVYPNNTFYCAVSLVP